MNPGVIVVGAGPAGLTAALALARAGIAVRILERESDQNRIVHQNRACSWHPASLDLLARLGVAADVVTAGVRVEELHWRDTHGRLLASMPMRLLDGLTSHPFRVHACQGQLTRILLAALSREPGVQLRLDAAVEAVDDSGGRVRVRTRYGWQAAPYVIAADGASSTIRTLLGLAWNRQQDPVRALRMYSQSHLESWLPAIGPLTYLRDEHQSGSVLRLPDHWQITVPWDEGRAPIRAQTLTALARRCLPRRQRGIKITAWQVLRQSRALLPTAFRRGRVLLVGDAAHLTGIEEDLGANAGLGDAFTAAQTLAAVFGGADPLVLEGWARARRRLIAETVLPLSRAHGRDADQAAVVDRLAHTAADPDRARAYLARTCLLSPAPALQDAAC